MPGMMVMNTQRGAATVPITLVLGFIVLLAVSFASRSLLFEMKASNNQVQAMQAHEAAEAGLEWATAQLNRVQAVGDDCLPSAQATALPLRHRIVDAGQQEASCVAVEGGWSCHCPASGPAREVATSGHRAYTLRFEPADVPGSLRVSATGHGGLGGSPARISVVLARLPGLDTTPAAALTVRGPARFDGAGFQLLHTSPASGGLTLHSGGALSGTPPLLVSTPGTPASTSALSDEPRLAALSAQGLHASLFRMDAQAWRLQPTAHTLDCTSACDAALAQSAARHALLHLQGGLRLATPVMLGSPSQPVLLVVDGPVELHAAAVIHGLIYARHAAWSDTAGATVRGAVVVENDLTASGSTRIVHDAAVLASLRQHTGTYARLGHSWQDL